ncbi:MAG TPA: leucyl/phenylalanyl-tRNA--protein transferase [Hyphomicrobiales bacterium]|nr:leucyl/phenylalanyl-tRNA--protein transferase [Hyphomicrobiales bacterium]
MSLPLPWLDPDSVWFPDPATALVEPNGLLAVGGDLSPARLLAAYQQGIFPWFEAGQPPLWWSPDPRMVLFPAEFHASRSLRKTLRSDRFTVTSDRDFAAVTAGCAAPRHGSAGTWLIPPMRRAYQELHRLGYAHSVEVWQDDALVGGLYGVALGQVFFGESMFSRQSDASKVAMAVLVDRLPTAGYRLIDCQVSNPHLESLGARNIARRDFLQLLPAATALPPVPAWPVEWSCTRSATPSSGQHAP